MKFENPIIGGFNPDPSVCVVGEDIYLANSSFGYFPGVPIHHSRDLVHWRQLGNVLDRPSQLCLDRASVTQGIYAPTLRHHGGRFWMTTTNVSHGGNFLVHAERPEGPWSEPVWIDTGTFDPDLCWDDDGTCWYSRSDEGNAIAQAPIDPETGRLLAPLKRVWENSGVFGIEGPHLYHIGDWWYLLVAGGGGCHRAQGHLVAIARGPAPDGPFTPCPFNPVLTQRDRMFDIIQATGHADLFQTRDGQWWMVFLGWRNYGGLGREQHPLGRETFLAPVDWHDGWPIPQVPTLEMSAGNLPSSPWPPKPVQEDFDAPALGPEWLYLRAPGCAALGERPGWLGIRGSEGFVGRRVEHPWSRTTCRIEARPGAGEAGLMLFLEKAWFIGLGFSEGKVFVRRSAGDWQADVAQAAFAGGPVEVEVLTNPWACRFTVTAGSQILLQHKCQTWQLSTSLAAGATGLVVALTTQNAELDCDWFAHEAWRKEMVAF